MVAANYRVQGKEITAEVSRIRVERQEITAVVL
jgi:hypothetical protein